MNLIIINKINQSPLHFHSYLDNILSIDFIVASTSL